MESTEGLLDETLSGSICAEHHSTQPVLLGVESIGAAWTASVN